MSLKNEYEAKARQVRDLMDRVGGRFLSDADEGLLTWVAETLEEFPADAQYVPCPAHISDWMERKTVVEAYDETDQVRVVGTIRAFVGDPHVVLELPGKDQLEEWPASSIRVADEDNQGFYVEEMLQLAQDALDELPPMDDRLRDALVWAVERANSEDERARATAAATDGVEAPNHSHTAPQEMKAQESPTSLPRCGCANAPKEANDSCC